MNTSASNYFRSLLRFPLYPAVVTGAAVLAYYAASHTASTGAPLAILSAVPMGLAATLGGLVAACLWFSWLVELGVIAPRVALYLHRSKAEASKRT